MIKLKNQKQKWYRRYFQKRFMISAVFLRVRRISKYGQLLAFRINYLFKSNALCFRFKANLLLLLFIHFNLNLLICLILKTSPTITHFLRRISQSRNYFCCFRMKGFFMSKIHFRSLVRAKFHYLISLRSRKHNSSNAC